MLGKPTRSHRHPDAVAAALSERTRGGFDAGGEAIFRMAGRDTVDLAEILNVIETDRGFVGDVMAPHAANRG